MQNDQSQQQAAQVITLLMMAAVLQPAAAAPTPSAPAGQNPHAFYQQQPSQHASTPARCRRRHQRRR